MSMSPLLIVCASALVMVTASRSIAIDERWVCSVKNSCLQCLKLAHCSWCKSENKCFSKKLKQFEHFCPNSTINHDEDYGLSLEENAECSCTDGKTELHCYPPGITEGLECSGRGQCKCGHCICNPHPENSSKVIMGEFCEFDNYSCKGSKCNEGPYSMSQPVILDDEVESIVNEGYEDAKR